MVYTTLIDSISMSPQQRDRRPVFAILTVVLVGASAFVVPFQRVDVVGELRSRGSVRMAVNDMVGADVETGVS
jgi:hypothetical protein